MSERPQHQTHDGYEIDRCDLCGFIYTKQIPSNDFLKQFYGAQYRAHTSNSVYVPKKSIGLKHWLLAKWLNSLVKDDTKKTTKKLLEIGCSQGELLSKFKDNKTWHAIGVDYGGAAIEYAQSQGLDAHLSDVESMRFSDGTFDAVVAIHMMEHVQNLNAFIREVHRVTKQGGYFFAVMPSMSRV